MDQISFFFLWDSSHFGFSFSPTVTSNIILHQYYTTFIHCNLLWCLPEEEEVEVFIIIVVTHTLHVCYYHNCSHSRKWRLGLVIVYVSTVDNVIKQLHDSWSLLPVLQEHQKGCSLSLFVLLYCFTTLTRDYASYGGQLTQLS